MSDRPAGYSRIQRRETHTSRAVPAIIVAVVLTLALAYLVTEIVLAALGQGPLLASPATMVQSIAAANTVPIAWLVIAGIVLGVFGVLLLAAALGAGRRPRHVLDEDRAVVIINNEVIASALVRTAADTVGIDPDRAVGKVSHRTATIEVTPTTGQHLDRAQITRALQEQLRSWDLKPALRPRVQVRKSGKVGA